MLETVSFSTKENQIQTKKINITDYVFFTQDTHFVYKRLISYARGKLHRPPNISKTYHPDDTIL